MEASSWEVQDLEEAADPETVAEGEPGRFLQRLTWSEIDDEYCSEKYKQMRAFRTETEKKAPLPIYIYIYIVYVAMCVHIDIYIYLYFISKCIFSRIFQV